MSDIYKRASQLSLRFNTPQGLLSVDDLWRIPLQSIKGNTSLDEISKALNKQLKSSDEDFSLIDSTKKTDSKIQLQFDIVKDVIETRLAERDIKAREKSEAERKQKILSIIADKKDKQLLDMPLEELEKLLAGDKVDSK